MIVSEKIKYSLAGMWNTIFGYCAGMFFYILLEDKIHITIISLISNIFAISMAFLIYKIFVFKTQGSWIREYLKCYLVYGGSAIASIILIWIFVDILKIKFWLAQGIIILMSFFISFFAHKGFTFKTTQHKK